MLSRLLQRKKNFVSGPIQGRLMFRIGLYWVLYHVVLWHAMFMFRYIEYRIESTTSFAQTSFNGMYHQFVLDFYPIIFCAALALPVVLVDIMHLTHRIAGPLVRFQNSLRDLAEGKHVPAVALRKGDLLMEFQDEFNLYLESLATPKSDPATAGPGLTTDDEQVLVEVEQLRKTVQNALVNAAATGESTEAGNVASEAQRISEEDTVISSTFPLS